MASPDLELFRRYSSLLGVEVAVGDSLKEHARVGVAQSLSTFRPLDP